MKKRGFRKSYKNTLLYFHENYITVENTNHSGRFGDSIIMHDCEHPIMKEHAKICTKNGGDILEVGFGMGISAGYIQSGSIKSHTIIENHFQIADRARDWAADKPNVTIIEGDWRDIYKEGKLKQYDGIFLDPNDISGSEQMFVNPPINITKPGCILTFYNGINRSDVHRGYKENKNPEVLKIPGTEFRPFNWKQDTLFWGLHQGEIYFLPKKVF